MSDDLSIQDQIERTKKRLLAETAMAERYPDLHLGEYPGGVTGWSSPQVFSDLSGLKILGDPNTMMTAFTLIEGEAVFCPAYRSIEWLLTRLREKNPAVYAEVVRTFADGVQNPV